MYVHIVGWGKHIPSTILTNDALSRLVDTSDSWITSRTGISERHIAAEDETTSTMAAEAARAALKRASLVPGDLDLIIVATVSPDLVFPSTACLVQKAIGARRAAAFDVAAACSGFVYALATASGFIKAGMYHNVLVVGAETMSRLVNWKERETCVLFGDGAGAVVLQGSAEPGGLGEFELGADGQGDSLLYVPAGGTRQPASHETVDAGLHYLRMNGSEVFRFGVSTIVTATQRVLNKAGLTPDDVALIIPHQANSRIIDAAARSLGVPAARMYNNLSRYGNTSAASIPIGLCDAMDEGRILPGDQIVMVGFGAGLTWGAATLEWSAPTPDLCADADELDSLLAGSGVADGDAAL